jgi:thymidylate synthase ThyX
MIFMKKIFIYDEFEPQDNAMLQALYSRSPMSVEKHVAKVKETGSGKFMEKFYVGYGHASIADCGSTTIFIEKLSILADKAVQDWPLYSGQETSTRYVDMSLQPIVDPVKNPTSKKILDNWMKFYLSNQENVRKYLRKKYPQKKEEKEDIYEKTIKARSFDILRGFLPAGITTQLSWHTNLRQAWDKLALMMFHPVPEIADIAKTILKKLKEKYPQSFSHSVVDKQADYRKFLMGKYNYFNPPKHPKFKASTTIKAEELNQYQAIFSRRPEKTGLPHFLTELGGITYDFLLDFGSFRDIQRHRNGVCRMPLLSTRFGFNKWYLNQLPKAVRLEAKKLIMGQVKLIKLLKASPEILQYYIALGFNVPCRVSYGLPATVYVMELRSGKAVHPTLRKIAHQMSKALQKMFPKLKIYCDLNPDDWDVRRGLQDITEKK